MVYVSCFYVVVVVTAIAQRIILINTLHWYPQNSSTPVASQLVEVCFYDGTRTALNSRVILNSFLCEITVTRVKIKTTEKASTSI